MAVNIRCMVDRGIPLRAEEKVGRVVAHPVFAVLSPRRKDDARCNMSQGRSTPSRPLRTW